jgi:hypothetical protein
MGALCFLASGILSMVGLILRGPIIDQAVQPEAFSQAAVSSRHVMAWSLLLPSLVVQMFGFMGVFAFLSRSKGDRWAFHGMWMSVAGNGFFLPFAGIIAFITPAVAKLYLEGRPEVIDIANAGLAGGFAMPFFILSAALLLVGSIAFGVAIWVSGTLPKWSAVPYVIHALMLTFVAPFAYPLELSGGVLLLLTTAWITWAIWTQTKTAKTVAQPQVA